MGNNSHGPTVNAHYFDSGFVSDSEGCAETVDKHGVVAAVAEEIAGVHGEVGGELNVFAEVNGHEAVLSLGQDEDDGVVVVVVGVVSALGSVEG